MIFAHNTLKHLGRTAVAICAAMILPSVAEAACSSPAGQEGDLRYDTTTKNFYFCNGTAWSFFSGLAPADYQVPTDIKYTNVSNTGNFYGKVRSAINGFAAMNEWAQANGCAGYHVCTVSDLERWMSAGNEVPPVVAGANSSAWVIDDAMSMGSWQYANCQHGGNPDGKHDAWSNEGTSRFATQITVYDADPPTSQLIIPMTTCNNSYRVACCKY